jgi:hypothetical protein
MNVHWKKSTNESKGKPEQKFDEAFGTILSNNQIAGLWALADLSMSGTSGLNDVEIETGGPMPLSGKIFLSLFYYQHFQILKLCLERLPVLLNNHSG